MAMVRTFIAAELQAQHHRDLGRLQEKLRKALRVGKGDIRWVRPENIHLTLKFLGDVPETELAQVCAATDMAVEQAAAFEVIPDLLGGFPPGKPPRVLWLGTREVPEALLALHKHLEESLEPLGYPSENRRFHPHLTLARISRPNAGKAVLHVLEEAKLDPFEPIAVGALIVFRSDLAPGGPTYTAMHHAALGG